MWIGVGETLDQIRLRHDERSTKSSHSGFEQEFGGTSSRPFQACQSLAAPSSFGAGTAAHLQERA
jgi:hypothetical protein